LRGAAASARTGHRIGRVAAVAGEDARLLNDQGTGAETHQHLPGLSRVEVEAAARDGKRRVC
jgi:hypothetical protein